MRGWLVWLAIIAVGAGGAFIFRDRISGNAGELVVGDCFDEPVGQELIDDVQHHPCNESHTAEVVFVGDMPGSDSVPTDADYDAFFAANCIPAFNAYTGRDFQSDEELDMGSLIPSDDGWRSGDHEMACYVIRIDGAATTESVRVAQ